MSKEVLERSTQENYTERPLPPPASVPRKQVDDEFETMDPKTLSDWSKKMIPWADLCRELKLKGASEEECITAKAENLQNGVENFIQLMNKHGDTMRQHTDELYSIADNLDEISKRTKIAGITGGATSVSGGLTASAEILAKYRWETLPYLPELGIGVGLTCPSAAIAHKMPGYEANIVNITVDQEKIQNTLQDYSGLSEIIQQSLKFITEGMDRLARHGQSLLRKTEVHPKRGSRIVTLVADGVIRALSLEESNRASGVIKGFSLGMDYYFTMRKDVKKVKKGLESKLAKKIRELTETLTKGLDEFIKLKDMFSKEG